MGGQQSHIAAIQEISVPQIVYSGAFPGGIDWDDVAAVGRHRKPDNAVAKFNTNPAVQAKYRSFGEHTTIYETAMKRAVHQACDAAQRVNTYYDIILVLCSEVDGPIRVYYSS